MSKLDAGDGPCITNQIQESMILLDDPETLAESFLCARCHRLCQCCMRCIWESLLKIETMDECIHLSTMLHCLHNEPVKSFGGDWINWNVMFPCHLSRVVKKHGPDAVDAGFQGVLLAMDKKTWVIGLGNSIRMRTASKVRIRSVFSRVDWGSMERAPRLATKFSVSP
jgi:hypothetical protein